MNENILLITVDSLRADHLGCYGYSKNTSPIIDEFADSGFLFKNAFSHAGTTRTSFPSILTSSSALMYGGYNRLSNDRILISEVLKNKNYKTGGFHSNLFLSSDFGYSRGFDKFFDSKESPSILTKARRFVKQNIKKESILYRALRKLFEETEKHAGVEFGSAYVRADDITDKAIKWLQNHEDQNIFLWIHYMDVHHPYVPPKKYQLMFRDSPISNRRSTKLRRKMLERPEEITEKELQDLIDLYDAEIRFTDKNIGRLIDNTKSILDDDIITIITSDHGEQFQEHGGFSHNTLHDEGIHVPLLINDSKNTGSFSEIVGLQDIPPTIADYAGCTIPKNFEGYSLLSLIKKGSWERNYIIGDWGGIEKDSRNFFYRDKNWKYINKDSKEYLYDINDDPNEKNNIFKEKKKSETIQKIKEKTKKHNQIIEETYKDITDVEMDQKTKERLKMLGYMDD